MYLSVIQKMNPPKSYELLIKTIYNKSKSVTCTHFSEYIFNNLCQINTLRLSTEEATSEKVFLKIYENSQENTSPRYFFFKNFIKKRPPNTSEQLLLLVIIH